MFDRGRRFSAAEAWAKNASRSVYARKAVIVVAFGGVLEVAIGVSLEDRCVYYVVVTENGERAVPPADGKEEEKAAYFFAPPFTVIKYRYFRAWLYFCKHRAAAAAATRPRPRIFLFPRSMIMSY